MLGTITINLSFICVLPHYVHKCLREMAKKNILDKQEKSKKIIFKRFFGDNFTDYLLNSSLHGLKYIGLPTITLFER